jgi:predicted transcriptional regulator
MLINYSETFSIYDLVRQILNSHERTAIIIDGNKKLMGVVTEGDILRALWSGIGMESPIDQCINFNPITVDQSQANIDSQVIDLFVNNGILIIPVIDENKYVKGFLKTREIVAKITNAE